MWGGVTTPDELRAIADVADQFKIPTVKVTGGQRIDLLGVKKQDLPAVWAQLNAAGLVSGFAYAKGLRTVKTCVGTDWCRFGTQDSTGLGIKLEKLLCGSWTPAKVKLAVSGCPRNCAEATVQGHRRDLRRFRLRHPCRRRGGPACARHRPARPCRQRGGGARIIARRSCRCIARRPPISSAFTNGSRRPGWSACATPIMEDHDDRKALYERFLISQRFARTRSLGRTRRRQGHARIHAAGGAVADCARRRRMTGVFHGRAKTYWFDVGPVTAIPLRGARAVQDAAPRHRGVPHRRATRFSRWRTSARTRAAP